MASVAHLQSNKNTRVEWTKWWLMHVKKILMLTLLIMGISKTIPGNASKGVNFTLIEKRTPALLEKHKIAGVGIAVIEEGKKVWSGYFGEQGPDIPVTDKTVFNTASVAKTIAAETLITLEEKGLLSLDDPIYTLVKHPDVKNDPRYRLLTPRILLSHRSGFLNWPDTYEDRKLAFLYKPGTDFSYSGIGIELASRYTERKLNKDFELLAFEHVLTPLGIQELSMGRVKPWTKNRLTQPMNNEGKYESHEAHSVRLSSTSNGLWSSADDLLVTVDAYTKLLIGLINKKNGGGIRRNIVTPLKNNEIWHCEIEDNFECASSYGHSIGWMVYQYQHHTLIKHGGNDQGENALVYYSPEKKSGAVIFVNGANGIFVTTKLLEFINNEPNLTGYYKQLVRRHFGKDL